MYCPECGGEVDENVRYCRHCGEEIGTKVSTIETGVDPVEPIDRAERVEHQCQSCSEMLRSGDRRAGTAAGWISKRDG